MSNILKNNEEELNQQLELLTQLKNDETFQPKTKIDSLIKRTSEQLQKIKLINAGVKVDEIEELFKRD